jgi:hypothetical protein
MADKVIQDPATAPTDPMPTDPGPELETRSPEDLMTDPAELPKLIEQAEANAENREQATPKKGKVAHKPKADVMARDMVHEFTSTFHFHVHDVGLLRFTDDGGGLYQLDHKGSGKYEFRMVGE